MYLNVSLMIFYVLSVVFLFNRGAYRLEDIILSADSEYIQEIHQLQTRIQPDDGCTIQFSSVRIFKQYSNRNTSISFKAGRDISIYHTVKPI